MFYWSNNSVVPVLSVDQAPKTFWHEPNVSVGALHRTKRCARLKRVSANFRSGNTSKKQAAYGRGSTLMLVYQTEVVGDGEAGVEVDRELVVKA